MIYLPTKFLIRIDTNATLRRIDLISGVLAPVLTGGVMAFTSRWISAVLIVAWNLVSLVLELYLYTSVYSSAEDILSNKISVKDKDKSKDKKKEICVFFNWIYLVSVEKKKENGLTKYIDLNLSFFFL